MKSVTKLLINEFKIKQLKYDFMGYPFKTQCDLSFHHLIISHKDCKKLHIPSEGYLFWNGAILNQETSHNYLHIIQRVDTELFYKITNEMIEQNQSGKLNIYNLKKIHEFLEYFEKTNPNLRNEKGKILIKEEFKRRVDL